MTLQIFGWPGPLTLQIWVTPPRGWPHDPANRVAHDPAKVRRPWPHEAANWQNTVRSRAADDAFHEWLRALTLTRPDVRSLRFQSFADASL
jgi:hypothetical protein